MTSYSSGIPLIWLCWLGGLLLLPACAESAETPLATDRTPTLVIDTAESPVLATETDRASVPAPTNPTDSSHHARPTPAPDRVATSPVTTTSAEPATPAPAEKPAVVTATPPPPDHRPWDRMLQAHVSADGQVDYAGLRRQRGQLKDYLATLARAIPAEDWSRDAAMAYWINAYNAFTVELILAHWPVESIQEIANGNPWEDKWIKLAGQPYSLNQIENEILRPRFKDPRIHFAVNCAALSCPPLHNRAFTAANLDRTLEQLTRAFINDERYNTISRTSAAVSKIFDWYREDFTPLHAFIDRYTTVTVDARTTFRFQDYDWGLNN